MEDENKKQLTERELDVLYYLSCCLTNREIGEILHVTHHTIKAHVASIIRKFSAKNRFEAVLIGQRLGFIKKPDDRNNG